MESLELFSGSCVSDKRQFCFVETDKQIKTNMMKGRNLDRINSFVFSNNLIISTLLLLK